MKKSFVFRILTAALLLTAVLCSALLTAQADVIWEPFADGFYSEHNEECEYEGRTYIANGSKGYVTVYRSPESDKIVDKIKNGNTFYISFTYSGGKEAMGVAEYKYDGELTTAEYSGDGSNGWIYMSELALEYDNTSFIEEHGSELTDYAGEFDSYIASGGNVVFYSYPDSGKSYEYTNEIDDSLAIQSVYIGAEGRKWGYVAYYYGNRDCWICIDDPANNAIPGIAVDNGELIPASDPASVKEEQQDAGISTTALAIIIVAGVVIITVVLLLIFWKKKK